MPRDMPTKRGAYFQGSGKAQNLSFPNAMHSFLLFKSYVDYDSGNDVCKII